VDRFLSHWVFHRESLVEGYAVDNRAAFEELLGGIDVLCVDNRISACRAGGQRQLNGPVIAGPVSGAERVADISEIRRPLTVREERQGQPPRARAGLSITRQGIRAISNPLQRLEPVGAVEIEHRPTGGPSWLAEMGRRRVRPGDSARWSRYGCVSY
jgi:hypothetical protein